MALHDSLFETIMHCQRSASLRSKVLGTRNLNMLLPEDLDFFIILPSFTGVLRNRDQSNDAAADTYQDALAPQRRELDLTAVTVNLSIMRDTDVLAERGATGYLKEWEIPFGIREEGIPSLNADGWSSPPRRVAKPPPVPAHIITYRVSNRQHRARCGYPTTVLFFFFFDDPRFSELVAPRAGGHDSMAKNATFVCAEATAFRGPQSLFRVSSPEADSIATASRGHYCSFWRNRSQPSTSELNAGTPLRSYGVDSLLAVEMASWILKETQVSLTVLEVFLATMPII